MAKIIGRKEESEELMRIFRRKEAQLVAVYGRRRVGKTFLIRELFDEHLLFYHTGVSPVELTGQNLTDAQLREFASTLRRSGYQPRHTPKDWIEAFDMLRKFLTLRMKQERVVVFIDEMPWMDTPYSGFITAFEHFWNGWASGQDQLMMVVCGSASSWIKDNLINSAGGLYDRVNTYIELSPFTLAETEQMLQEHEISLNRYGIAEIYMAIGGVPFYLSQLQPGLSAPQQIDRLFFAKKAKLNDEFDRLFLSTFVRPDDTKAIIRYLATRHIGFSREEIAEKLKISGKDLTQILRSLEAADMISKYQPFGNNKRQLMYRLIDPFCRFWLQQVEGQNRNENYWKEHCGTSIHSTWSGIAFEELCMNHLIQIKRGLKVEGISSHESAWTLKGTQEESGAQIDLIISRADNVVNLCEMKYYHDEYKVDSDEERKLRHRMAVVMEQIKKKESLQLTLITTYGLASGIHSHVFSNVVTLDDLFN